MFQKNDKPLLIARIIFMILIAICVICTFVSGIYISTSNALLGIRHIIIGLLLCFVFWIFIRLFLSFLCDVKLIRNKLYDNSNKDLDVFLVDKKSVKNNDIEKHKTNVKTVQVDNMNFALREDFYYELINYDEDYTLNVTAVTVPSEINGMPVYSIIYAFENCKSLTNAKISYGIQNIGKNTFKGCMNLADVTIPSTIKSIGNEAFSECDGLNSIIPKEVTKIGKGAFTNCKNLTIYCETDSAPSSWDSEWNYSDCPVVWGFKNN